VRKVRISNRNLLADQFYGLVLRLNLVIQVCNYIKESSKDFQCIVISLKDMFYEHSDSLVGICRDVERCLSYENILSVV
jgi:hypothetical protein